MGCGATGCNVVHHICTVLQVLLAIAIIVVVAVPLSDYSVNISGVDYGVNCLLGNESTTSSSLCNYVYACITCHFCGLGGILDLLFAIAGTAWWAIGGGIVTSNANKNVVLTTPDSTKTWGLPQSGWRDTVVVSMWIECGLFGLLVISGIARSCCRCCGGGKDAYA
eukprot:scaffold3.g6402.t1